jgi:S1-C subfamily serine protease
VDRSAPRNPRYVAILALAACLILIVGWLIRPREVTPVAAPIPSESELAQLARRTERRSLETMTGFFAETARQVESSVVYLPSTGASGIVWQEGLVVTAPFDGRAVGALVVETPAGAGNAEPAVWGPQLPLATVRRLIEWPGLTPARRAVSPARPGDWIVAVWRTARERPFAMGSFLQLDSVTCGDVVAWEAVSSLALTRAMAGGGLFDVDGSLLAVILPCDGRFAAIDVFSVETVLQEAETFEQRVLARYGLVLEMPTEAETLHFKLDGGGGGGGVIVREVWSGHPHAASALWPGDVIVSLDKEAVAGLESLQPLATAPRQQAFEVGIRRGSARLTIPLSPHDSSASTVDPSDTGVGVVWESPEPSYRIDSVVPGSRAAAAGLQPGDRIVRVDHREPESFAQIQRLLAAGRALPVFLEVQRGDRRLGILLS